MSANLAPGSDIVLELDAAGVIQSIALGTSVGGLNDSRSWVGRAWIETVAEDSRNAVTEMLAEVASGGLSPRRLITHVSSGGDEFPVVYTVMHRTRPDRLVALGLDLRGMQALEHRLVNAQQSLERDYRRMRHVETRYRLLFQVSGEAMLILDGGSLKVVEANPAAARLFDQPAKRLIGRTFPFDIDPESEAAVIQQLAVSRIQGRADDSCARLAPSGRKITISLSSLQEENSEVVVVRLTGEMADSEPESGPASAGAVLSLLDGLPDGFVVADVEGRVWLANRAFLGMAELASREQALGRPLSRWVGRPGADLDKVLALLREHGVVRLFSTTMRGELGSHNEVELSSVLTAEPGPQVGFVIRDVGRRLVSSPRGTDDLNEAVARLTTLVGQVTLKTLVRDTTGLLERHFIEAALELTDDNRTSAAEVLGLSRQSLYMKLRRYGLTGENGSEG